MKKKTGRVGKMTECQIKDLFKRTRRHSITAQSFENNDGAKKKEMYQKI